ncbi:MAG: sodium-dependent bicarbonate transport family permease [Alphaproteobacteria bacterium]|nr:sodium-dependent bicarbonate transport family permease [Alphaproteobacteria bacterium]
MDLSLALQNLMSPSVLFFALGVAAALARSDLAIPQNIAKGMSLYLMLAIGYKGGVAAIQNGLGLDLFLIIVTATILSLTIPLIAYFFLNTTTKLSQIDKAAIAAHYGSISIVTFIAATSTLEQLGIEYPGIMVAAAAAMEAPAIAVALFLAYRGTKKKQSGSGDNLWREVLLNASIVLLIGAFLIGMITGEKGYSDIAPFITDPFKGILCLFLLDMGLVAGRELRQVRSTLTPALLAFGIYMPIVGGFVGTLAAQIIGLDHGGTVLLAMLSASASYIAVPAAMRVALPEAKPSIYLTLSLGITFPFNLTIGIPIFVGVANFIV